jgi:hypothetical protein
VPKNNRRNSNATKHGLLSAGITELDDAELYRANLRDLNRQNKPVGFIEKKILERIARHAMRLSRAEGLEAEYISSVLNPVIRDFDRKLTSQVLEETCGAVVNRGLPARMSSGDVQPLVLLYQRYISGIEQQLYRALHELERLQRMRQGERVPAPVALDVNIDANAGDANSLVAFSDTKVLEGSVPNIPDRRKDPNLGDHNLENKRGKTSED